MEKVRPRNTKISSSLDWSEFEISENFLSLKGFMEQRPRLKHQPKVTFIKVEPQKKSDTEELW